MAAAVRALTGVHRPSGRERIWVGATSTVAGGFLIALGVVLLLTAHHASPFTARAVAVGSIATGIFLGWNLWRFVNSEYRVTEQGFAYHYPPHEQRWSVPLEAIDSMRRVAVQDGERLRLSVRSGRSRWVYLTRSMRDALDSLPGGPAA